MTSRSLAALALGVFLGSIPGCKEQSIGARYRAERDFWKASRMERSLQIAKEDNPDRGKVELVLRAYEIVLRRNPLPDLAASADTAVLHGIGRVRGQAELRMVPLYAYLEKNEELDRLLTEARRSYGWELGLAIQFYLLSIDHARQQGDLQKVAALNQEMASTLPARLAGGAPVVPVQDAPIRAADALASMNRQEEAMGELDRAEVYYRTIIQEGPNDESAALAWLQLGTIETRRGRFDRAAEHIEQARRSPASERLQPRVLFALGQLHQEGRRDLESAARIFSEMAERFPEDPMAPEAMVRRAACLGELGRHNEALEILTAFRAAYPAERTMGARASLIQARLLERSDRWQESMNAYRSLAADYPTSEEAITAPFEIVAHYRRIGEESAARSTLTRAIEEYDRLKRDYPGTPLAWQAEERAARALMDLGDWSGALERLVGMPETYPRDPRNPLVLVQASSIAAVQMKDNARAAAILEDLASRYPDSPLAARAREEIARLRGR